MAIARRSRFAAKAIAATRSSRFRDETLSVFHHDTRPRSRPADGDRDARRVAVLRGEMPAGFTRDGRWRSIEIDRHREERSRHAEAERLDVRLLHRPQRHRAFASCGKGKRIEPGDLGLREHRVDHFEDLVAARDRLDVDAELFVSCDRADDDVAMVRRVEEDLARRIERRSPVRAELPPAGVSDGVFQSTNAG